MDGERVIIYNPIATSDSVIGMGEGRDAAGVRLLDIHGIEVYRVDGGKTLLFVAGMGGALLLLNAIVCMDGCFGPDNTDDFRWP